MYFIACILPWAFYMRNISRFIDYKGKVWSIHNDNIPMVCKRSIYSQIATFLYVIKLSIAFGIWTMNIKLTDSPFCNCKITKKRFKAAMHLYVWVIYIHVGMNRTVWTRRDVSNMPFNFDDVNMESKIIAVVLNSIPLVRHKSQFYSMLDKTHQSWNQ